MEFQDIARFAYTVKSSSGMPPQSCNNILMGHIFCLFALALGLAVIGCSPAPSAQPAAPEKVTPQPRADYRTLVVEDWLRHPEILHYYKGGLGFDVASPEGGKYLERGGAWRPTETVLPEAAERDGLPWASGRDVRWLAGTTATFHFPLVPVDSEGEYTLHLQLRPKVNATADVRFYRMDGKSENAWSETKTVQLRPGWHDNTLQIPHSWLNENGAQLMRISFPGTYFEGDARVSAKFVHIFLEEPSDGSRQTGAKSADDIRPNFTPVEPCRIDDRPRDALHVPVGGSLARYFVVPEGGAQLSFDAAPSPWLMDSTTLAVTIDTDDTSFAGSSPDYDRDVDADVPTHAEPLRVVLNTGAPWTSHTVDLSPYAGEAVRITVSAEPAEITAFPKADLPEPAVCLASAHIETQKPADEIAALEKLRGTRRVVVVAIDNLRHDRALSEAGNAVAPNLLSLRDHAVYGMAMAEAPGGIATTASFLTGAHFPQHGVNDNATHLRSSFNTIAEALPMWQSHFYTTTSAIDPARGFAQGFADVRRLNKEKLSSPADAFRALAGELDASPAQSLFYLHIGALRLPLTPSKDSLSRFADPNYNGPVTPQALQNLAVLKDPAPADSKQFAAYYDASLSELDTALGDFIQNLPEDTILLLFGTHSCSLGESTLGYMQTLSPWETTVPWFIYSKSLGSGYSVMPQISITALRATLLDILGNEGQTESLIQKPASNPASYWNNAAAAASTKYYYKLLREGVEKLYLYDPNQYNLQLHELPFAPITQQAFREWIP